MKLEILGTGCSKCKKLYDLVSEAVRESGISADVIKVENLNDIMNYNVISLPALAIDGKVALAGRVPSKDEIRKLITGTPPQGGCCGCSGSGCCE